MKKTKIIATVGPSIEKESLIEKAINEGVNVFRINFSHANHAYHLKSIKKIRAISKKLDKPIAILGDLKGPEIRTDTQIYTLIKDKKIHLSYYKNKLKDAIGITHKTLYQLVKKGQTIFIDDGLLKLTVLKIQKKDILCKVINGGKLTQNKSINIPNILIKLPIINQKDKEDLNFIIKNDLDGIAASFISNQEDVKKIRAFLKQKKSEITIISKIENQASVTNLDSIIDVSDGIMVARGDLGVEFPTEFIPVLQNEIIEKTKKKGKIIIVATQMLDSMIKNPRPTRAEATDISNAALQRVDAVMLSGETASGAYPIEAIKIMKKIILKTEESQSLNIFPIKHKEEISIICKASLMLAMENQAKLLITISFWGKSARLISSYRSEVPTIVACFNEKLYSKSQLYYSIEPIKITYQNSIDKQFKEIEKKLKKVKLVKKGDLVIFMFTYPEIQNKTNSIRKWVIK